MTTVFGYYGYNNAGDEAFRLVFDQVLPGPVDYRNPAAPPEPGGVVVLGGGAVLNGYFLDPLLAGDVAALHVVGCSLPYGQGDCARLAPLADRIRTLLVRSRADVAVLRKAGLDAGFIPDLVFALDRAPEPFDAEDLLRWTALGPRGWGRHARTLVVCPSDDYHVPFSSGRTQAFARIEALKDELAAALDQASEKFNLLFLPFSVWHSARDYLFAHDVVRRMRRRDAALVVERAVPAERLMDILAALEGPVVSMKYHGLVFGMRAAKLCINVGATRKNRDLMTDAGLDGLSFPYERLTAARLLSAIEKHRERRLLDQVTALRDAWGEETRARLGDFAAALAESGAARPPVAAAA